RLARPFRRQGNERVRGIRGARLVSPGPARVAKDAVDVRLPGRVESRAGIGCQARLEPVRPVGIGPFVRAPLLVQAPRPCPIVGFGAGVYFTATISEPL